MTETEFCAKWSPKLDDYAPDRAHFLAWCLFYLSDDADPASSPDLTEAELREAAQDYLSLPKNEMSVRARIRYLGLGAA